VNALRNRITLLEGREAPERMRRGMRTEEVVERLRMLMAGKLPLSGPTPPGKETNLQRLLRERCQDLGV